MVELIQRPIVFMSLLQELCSLHVGESDRFSLSLGFVKKRRQIQVSISCT